MMFFRFDSFLDATTCQKVFPDFSNFKLIFHFTAIETKVEYCLLETECRGARN